MFRTVVWWCWGVVYWPFLLIGLVLFGISTGFYAVGEWLHDLLVDFAFPLPKAK